MTTTTRIKLSLAELRPLSSFLRMCIPICELLTYMFNLDHVLKEPEAKSCETGFDELLGAIADFGPSTQEKLSTSRQRLKMHLTVSV